MNRNSSIDFLRRLNLKGNAAINFLSSDKESKRLSLFFAVFCTKIPKWSLETLAKGIFAMLLIKHSQLMFILFNSKLEGLSYVDLLCHLHKEIRAQLN